MLYLIAQLGLWIPCTVAQLLIGVQMMRSRLSREFPAFFTYTMVRVIESALLYSFYRLELWVAYFIGYWIGEAIDVALGLAVIYELYSHVFCRYEALHRLTALLFRWAAAILILVGVVSAASAPGVDSDRMMAGLFVFGRSAAIVKVGLLLLLFTFASYFRLTWRHYALGIAVGLGLFATVDLAAIAIRTQAGSIANVTYAFVKGVAYNCSVVVWICYFFGREQVAGSLETPPPSDLLRWNEALTELLTR